MAVPPVASIPWSVRSAASPHRLSACFDSGEQWRRTLSLGDDWLRLDGYPNADLPIDEVRDLLPRPQTPEV